MPASIPTKDRILDEAMALFAAQGFKATSVVQIERAAGLTPGAGGIYHHFKSKESLLRAGVERHLSRLDAWRDIRQVLFGLGDLRVELTVTARYFLAELDSQVELFRILLAEAGLRPTLLNDAMELLIVRTYETFAEWLRDESGIAVGEERARTIATLALGSLLSTRLLDGVLEVKTFTSSDDDLVETWVEMVMAMVTPDGPMGVGEQPVAHG
ncbi:MAG TPA: TetR/AcrR family transcriptional regulator [Acidimicrobiales bacterium]|nr:TetR/AcrR family transcriptional regulator [Acidimicrobiales bacterium]